MRTLNMLSQEMGFKYQINQDYGRYGYIQFDNGVHHIVSRTDIRINRVGPYVLAMDKFSTDMILQEFGHPTVPADLFFSEAYRADYRIEGNGLENALKYADELTYPVIVKPNVGLKGTDVNKIFTKKQLRKILFKLFKKYDQLLVQKFAEGIDYRVIVYNGEVISAYQRIPLTVTGDGEKTIIQFLEERKQQSLIENRSVTFDTDAIDIVLKRNNRRLTTVLSKGEKMVLLDNANLSTGGTAVDVTEDLHPDFKKAAIQSAYDMNLRLTGVDMIINQDHTQTPEKDKWHFLEVNASPGFDWYSRLGEDQHMRIVELFRTILNDIKSGVIKP